LLPLPPQTNCNQQFQIVIRQSKIDNDTLPHFRL
jgi:hypothetical protein